MPEQENEPTPAPLPPMIGPLPVPTEKDRRALVDALAQILVKVATKPREPGEQQAEETQGGEAND